MSASLRTKDGMFSPAADLMALDVAQVSSVRVSAEEAVAWARENRIPLDADQDTRAHIAQINALRLKLELPPFALDEQRGGRTAPVSRTATAPVPQPPSEENKLAALPRPVLSLPRRAESTLLCRTQDELLSLVLKYDGTRTGLVTPEIASWLLALNTANRPLQKSHVQRFREILLRGLWVNTGEAVIVSKEGILNDGQHRLNAVVASGVPALMDVRFGIARSAFAATGTGARRTASQALAISGVRSASSQAAIARLLVHYDAGEMGKASQQVENDLLLKTIEAEPQIAEIAAMIQRYRFAPARTSPFGMILVVAARSVPMERVAAFGGTINTGLAESDTDPAYQLHTRLRDAALRRERISQIDAAALTARAWNAWVAGRQMHRLVLQEGDRTSEGFPKVMSA